MKSDGTRPTGTVFFITGGDIRAKAREWQFVGVKARLAKSGVGAVVTNVPPAGRDGILGILAGSADVVPAQYGAYLPGSICDHLTSYAAVFDSGYQTKLTAWIEAGATVSAGTITEPTSRWTKFPSAWVYAHYANGCTAIESMYQAVSCPLQLLIVGEPLACPWAPEAAMTLSGLEKEEVSGVIRVSAEVRTTSERMFTRHVFLLDGRTIPGAAGVKAKQEKEGNTIEIDTTTIPAGRHTIRAVAYGAGSVRAQVFAEREIKVGRR